MYEPPKRNGQASYLGSRGFGRSSLADTSAIFGLRESAAALAAGKKPTDKGTTVAGAHPLKSKDLVSYEEFYEVFSEIRLP